MANALFRILSRELIAVKGQQIRYGHKVRGKPPGVARTLAQRLEGWYNSIDNYLEKTNLNTKA